MNYSGLGELVEGPLAFELVLREEKVVFPLLLPGARGARGARHRVAHVLPALEQHPSDRRLAAARRRRQDQRKRDHSRFSTCSRIRSSSSLISTTSASIAASLALLPVVFASRSISCSRKPSLLPTGSPDAPLSPLANAATCARNRSISSLTSSRSARIATSCARRCSS